MYAGGDSQMNGDMPRDGGHGGGGHAIGDELEKTGRYERWCHEVGMKNWFRM